MSETKAPNWLRAFDIVFGLIAAILSVVVFVSPGFGFLALILLLSVTFMFNGIARIM
ncbi:hypothetical protein MUO71_01280 [Candidatus Bathyarchaeota archaeon]|nr:hypothetical protein [Candidatus Bathyarchaeota archaeon]